MAVLLSRGLRPHRGQLRRNQPSRHGVKSVPLQWRHLGSTSCFGPPNVSAPLTKTDTTRRQEMHTQSVNSEEIPPAELSPSSEYPQLHVRSYSIPIPKGYEQTFVSCWVQRKSTCHSLDLLLSSPST